MSLTLPCLDQPISISNHIIPILHCLHPHWSHPTAWKDLRDWGELVLGPLPRSSSLISNGSTLSLQRSGSVGRPYPPGLGWTPQVTPHDEGRGRWRGETRLTRCEEGGLKRMWFLTFCGLNFGERWKTLRIWINFWEGRWWSSMAHVEKQAYDGSFLDGNWLRMDFKRNRPFLPQFPESFPKKNTKQHGTFCYFSKSQAYILERWTSLKVTQF